MAFQDGNDSDVSAGAKSEGGRQKEKTKKDKFKSFFKNIKK
jgi:hypothetical protein